MKKQQASSESKNPTIVIPRPHKKASLKKIIKQDKFNAQLLKGKTKVDAGVAVGYAMSTSRNASQYIEDDDSRDRLAELYERHQILPKAVAAIDRGLSAKRQVVSTLKTESWTKQGKVSEEKVVVTEVEDFELQVRSADIAIRSSKRDSGLGINNFGPTQFIIDL